MQVEKISVANSAYKPQNVNFRGRLYDDKVVQKILESEALESGKLTFSQNLSRIKNSLFGQERVSFFDGNGKMTNPGLFEYDRFERKFISHMPDNLLKFPEMRTIYRFTKDEFGILSVEKMRFDKHNRLRTSQYISPYDGLDKTVYRYYGPDGKEASYTVKAIDPKTGKVVSTTTYDSQEGNILMKTDANGKFLYYAEKGEFSTTLHHNGELSGYIVDNDTIYHFEKEDYPFLERYNVNRTENSKFMAFLKAIIPNKNQSRVVCYKFDRNYKYIGKTTLPKDVSIENVLRLHRNGTLKDFHYSKKFE